VSLGSVDNRNVCIANYVRLSRILTGARATGAHLINRDPRHGTHSTIPTRETHASGRS